MEKTRRERSNFRMTVRWKNFRSQLIEQRGAVCECCGTKYYGKQRRGLQIHHLDTDNYEYLVPERFKILCSSCHEALTERMSTKILGKKSNDIPNLEVWVKLLYEFLPYKTRIVLKDKHDTYLTEHLPEWITWKERDATIFNNSYIVIEEADQFGILTEGELLSTNVHPKSKKKEKKQKIRKQGERPIKKQQRKKNDERLFMS